MRSNWSLCLDNRHRIGQFIKVRILAVERHTMALGRGGDPEVVFGDGLPFDGQSLLQFGLRGGCGVIRQEENHIVGESLLLLDGAAAVPGTLKAKAHFTQGREREIQLRGRLERGGDRSISGAHVPDDDTAV